MGYALFNCTQYTPSGKYSHMVKVTKNSKILRQFDKLTERNPADCCSHPDVSCISCPKDGPYCCAVIPGLQHEISANEIRSS